MAFSKGEDQIYRWEYHGSTTTEIRYGMSIAMVIIFVIVPFVVFAADLNLQHIKKNLFLVGFSYLVILLFFGILAVIVKLCTCFIYRNGPGELKFSANDERCAMSEQIGGLGGRNSFCFEDISKLCRCKSRNKIIAQCVITRGVVYASDEDYEQVWAFFVDHCPGAKLEEHFSKNDAVAFGDGENRKRVLRGKSRIRRMTDVRSILFGVELIGIIMGISMGTGWMTRGARISDFSGVGKATIISYQQVKSNRSFQYEINVACEIEERSFQTLWYTSSRKGREVGDVVPITYNVKNVDEYVIGMTPAEYSLWYRVLGWSSFLAIAAAVVSIVVRRRLKKCMETDY